MPKSRFRINYPPGEIRNLAEAQYARMLMKTGENYIYQPEVRLSTGIYHPDFYLIASRHYIEIVGSRQAYHIGRQKYEVFRKQHPDKILLILKPDAKPYRSKEFLPSAQQIDEALKKILKSKHPKPVKPFDRKLLKNVRERLGFDKTTFGKLIGASYWQISQWENESGYRPNLYHTKLLNDILNELERETYTIGKIRLQKNNIIDIDDLILLVDVLKILNLDRQKFWDNSVKFKLWYKQIGRAFVFSRKEVQELADKRKKAFKIIGEK